MPELASKGWRGKGAREPLLQSKRPAPAAHAGGGGARGGRCSHFLWRVLVLSHSPGTLVPRRWGRARGTTWSARVAQTDGKRGEPPSGQAAEATPPRPVAVRVWSARVSEGSGSGPGQTRGGCPGSRCVWTTRLKQLAAKPRNVASPGASKPLHWEDVRGRLSRSRLRRLHSCVPVTVVCLPPAPGTGRSPK